MSDTKHALDDPLKCTDYCFLRLICSMIFCEQDQMFLIQLGVEMLTAQTHRKTKAYDIILLILNKTKNNCYQLKLMVFLLIM